MNFVALESMKRDLRGSIGCLKVWETEMGRVRIVHLKRGTPLLTARLLGRANLLRTTEIMETKEPKPAPVAKPKRTLRRLTQHEYFLLCNWLQAATFAPSDTYVAVAGYAEKALGFPVADSSITDAMKALGIALPRNAAAVDQSAKIDQLNAAIGDLESDVKTLRDDCAFLAMVLLNHLVPRDHSDAQRLTDIFNKWSE